MSKCVWVLAIVVAMVGCDDGGGGGTDAGGGGTDAGGAMTSPVEFVVAEIAGLGDIPLTGAMVALDTADGVRTEMAAGADGHVTFEVDWTAGPIAVTAAAPGHTMASYVGLSQTAIESGARFEGATAIYLAPLPVTDAERVNISGTLQNIVSSANSFNLAFGVRGAVGYQGPDADWTAMVPSGQPFAVTALEFTAMRNGPQDFTQTLHQMALVSSDGFSADGTLDIDFTADALTLNTVDVTIPRLPTGHTLRDSLVYSLVRSQDNGQTDLYGSMTSTTPPGDADTSISASVTFGETSTVTQPVTQYFYQDGPRFVSVSVPGWPSAGAQDLSFLDVPEIIDPAFGETHGLNEPFAFNVLDENVSGNLNVHLADDDETLVWRIFGPADGDRLRIIPELPSFADGSALFPSGVEIFVRPISCEPDPALRICVRVGAGNRVFDIVAP